GGRVVGVCGGLQMLGERVGSDSVRGLGLLPLRTAYGETKLTHRIETHFEDALGAPWAPLAGRRVRGYEIRHGETETTAPAQVAISDQRGWSQDSVLGVTLHGIFDDPDLLEALFGRRPERPLDLVLDELTDAVMAGLDRDRLDAIVGR
ncbi:MAG: cobyric acid synthase CobQ, partial [Solirubrobacterales bacterium]